MTNDLTWSETQISNSTFKKTIDIVNNYAQSGKIITDDRLIYPNYPNMDIAIQYWRYKEILNRWESYKKVNGKEPESLYIQIPAVDVSCDDKILPINTILDMEKRVKNYLANGGIIQDTRRIYLDMSTRQEFITYTRYKEIMNRVETFRKTNNRDPQVVYIIPQSNENNTTRPNAVGDDITPNGNGWYIVQRYRPSDIVQIYNWDCGPNATQQAYYEISGKRHDEKEIIKIEGTTTNGTDHNGITKGFLTLAKEDGINVNVNWQYFSDLGYDNLGKAVKDIKRGVLQHSRYKYKYGHYEYILGVNPTTKKYMIANSLSGGWIEFRTFSKNTAYLNLISQKSICIAEKQ